MDILNENDEGATIDESSIVYEEDIGAQLLKESEDLLDGLNVMDVLEDTDDHSKLLHYYIKDFIDLKRGIRSGISKVQLQSLRQFSEKLVNEELQWNTEVDTGSVSWCIFDGDKSFSDDGVKFYSGFPYVRTFRKDVVFPGTMQKVPASTPGIPNSAVFLQLAASSTLCICDQSGNDFAVAFSLRDIAHNAISTRGEKDLVIRFRKGYVPLGGEVRDDDGRNVGDEVVKKAKEMFQNGQSIALHIRLTEKSNSGVRNYDISKWLSDEVKLCKGYLETLKDTAVKTLTLSPRNEVTGPFCPKQWYSSPDIAKQNFRFFNIGGGPFAV